MLATGYPLREYRRLVAAEDRKGLARFLKHRFEERYVTPMSGPGVAAFPKAGLSCMLLEALECFRKGEGLTPEGQSRAYFTASLGSHKPFTKLAKYEKTHYVDFLARRAVARKQNLPDRSVPDYTIYSGVRCGILHQGETTAGWRLRKDVPEFDPELRVLNAHWFQRETTLALGAYCHQLTKARWEDDPWKHFRAKMDATIEHVHEASATREPEE